MKNNTSPWVAIKVQVVAIRDRLQVSRVALHVLRASPRDERVAFGWGRVPEESRRDDAPTRLTRVPVYPEHAVLVPFSDAEPPDADRVGCGQPT